MIELLLHGERIESVFRLLGRHENDLTYSLAWALSQSPQFLRHFVRNTLGVQPALDTVVIRLQQSEKDSGITDIEIESPGRFFIIVEAKCGWILPARQQLETYAARPSFTFSKSTNRRILVLSECSPEYASLKLDIASTNGVEIRPLSWKEVVDIADRAQRGGSHAEKRILRELLTYLRGLMTMQNIESNWVFVVSLGSDTPEGWQISWIDVVKKKRRYFNPVGGGWPKEPPNYIAFRYHGRLQSIHHIEGYDIFENPHDRFSEIPSANWGPHFLYRLSPPFAPASEVRTGNIFRNGRVWCMLDTLFLAGTIAEARDMSRRRSEQSG